MGFVLSVSITERPPETPSIIIPPEVARVEAQLREEARAWAALPLEEQTRIQAEEVAREAEAQRRAETAARKRLLRESVGPTGPKTEVKVDGPAAAVFTVDEIREWADRGVSLDAVLQPYVAFQATFALDVFKRVVETAAQQVADARLTTTAPARERRGVPPSISLSEVTQSAVKIEETRRRLESVLMRGDTSAHTAYQWTRR